MRNRKRTVFSTGHVPGYSCDHEWQSVEGVARRETCAKCGATCERDTDGQIVHYDNTRAAGIEST